jgi:MFS family permease
MVGPSIAGGVIALLGSGVGATGWVILVNAASYFAVVVSLKMMRSEDLRPVPLVPRGKGQLRAGVAYVRSRPDIMLVMGVVFSAGTFGLNFQMTTALMATKVYDKGAGEYGVLGSIVAVGSLAGALLAARRTTSRQRLVVVSGVAFGVVTMIAGLMPSYLTFALILPVCGFAALTLVTAATAFVQMAVDASMRGRVMALYMAVFMGGTPFGAPLFGWIADHAGARWTLIGGGASTAAGTVVAVLLSTRRQGLVITRYFRSAPHPADADIGPVVAD